MATFRGLTLSMTITLNVTGHVFQNVVVNVLLFSSRQLNHACPFLTLSRSWIYITRMYSLTIAVTPDAN